MENKLFFEISDLKLAMLKLQEQKTDNLYGINSNQSSNSAGDNLMLQQSTPKWNM